MGIEHLDFDRRPDLDVSLKTLDAESLRKKIRRVQD